jgi:hypothetical protein
MSPARRLLYERPTGCNFASKAVGRARKNLTFGVNDFPCFAREIRIFDITTSRKSPSKRLSAMHLFQDSMFVVKLAVW